MPANREPPNFDTVLNVALTEAVNVLRTQLDPSISVLDAALDAFVNTVLHFYHNHPNRSQIEELLTTSLAQVSDPSIYFVPVEDFKFILANIINTYIYNMDCEIFALCSGVINVSDPRFQAYVDAYKAMYKYDYDLQTNIVVKKGIRTTESIVAIISANDSNRLYDSAAKEREAKARIFRNEFRSEREVTFKQNACIFAYGKFTKQRSSELTSFTAQLRTGVEAVNLLNQKPFI